LRGKQVTAFGHLTLFLNLQSEKRKATLNFGAAASARWDRNSLAAISIPFEQIEKLIR
jgi:hypothetical protein